MGRSMQDQTRIYGRGDTLAMIRDAAKQRRRELGIPLLELDDISGVQSGYAAKLEAGIKNLGYISLPCILGALGLELLVVEKPKSAA